nr:NAD(P)/FAD-dependent oxidoreductase [Providencia burhodogranariea]
MVIGGGPAGLSAAYELVRTGVQPLVLERTASVGDVWRNHYDGLRLNTGRWFSTLPGVRFPKSAGLWPERDIFADILETLPERGKFAVRTDCEIMSIEYDQLNSIWVVTCKSNEKIRSKALVVATGSSRIPFVPEWDGRAQFKGTITHSANFQNAQKYKDKHVLVVGSGNSSCEIACRLLPYAASVSLSVRTLPYFLPKSLWGVPFAALGVILNRLPTKASDAILRRLSGYWTGNLTEYGLAAPSGNVSEIEQVTPTLYMPIINEIKNNKIKILGPLISLDEISGKIYTSVDKLEEINLKIDAIVSGTGFKTGLDSLLNIPDILNANGKPNINPVTGESHKAGLFFIGFKNPLSGQLREIGLQAPIMAKAIKNYLQR